MDSDKIYELGTTENNRPEMKQIRIKVMNKYDGEFGADMALDADGSEQ